MAESPSIIKDLPVLGPMFHADTRKAAVKDALAHKGNDEIFKWATKALIGSSEIVGKGLEVGIGVPATLAAAFGQPAVVDLYRTSRRIELSEDIEREKSKPYDQDWQLDIGNAYAFVERFKKGLKGDFNLLTPEGRASVFKDAKVNVPFSKLIEIGPDGKPKLREPLGTGLKAEMVAGGEAAFQKWFGDVMAEVIGPDGKTKIDPTKLDGAVMKDMYKVIYEAVYARFEEVAELNKSARVLEHEVTPVRVSRSVDNAFKKIPEGSERLSFSIGSQPVVINFAEAVKHPGDPDMPLYIKDNLGYFDGEAMLKNGIHSRDLFDDWFMLVLEKQGIATPAPTDETYRDFMTAYQRIYERFMAIIDPRGIIAANEEDLPFHTGARRSETDKIQAKMVKPLRLLLGDITKITTPDAAESYVTALQTITNIFQSHSGSGAPVLNVREWQMLDRETQQYIRDAVAYFRDRLRAFYLTSPAAAHPLVVNRVVLEDTILNLYGDPSVGIDGLIDRAHVGLPPLPPYNPAAIARYAAGSDPLSKRERSPGLQAIRNAFAHPRMIDRSGKVAAITEFMGAPGSEILAAAYLDGRAIVTVPLSRGPGTPPGVEIDFGHYFTRVNTLVKETADAHPLTKTVKPLETIKTAMGKFEGTTYKVGKLSRDVIHEELLKLWKAAFKEKGTYISEKFPHPGAPNFEEYSATYRLFYENIMAIIDPDRKYRKAEETYLYGGLLPGTKGKKSEIPFLGSVGLSPDTVKRLDDLAKNKNTMEMGLGFALGTTLSFKSQAASINARATLPQMIEKYEELKNDFDAAKSKLELAGFKASVEKLQELEKSLRDKYQQLLSEGIHSLFPALSQSSNQKGGNKKLTGLSDLQFKTIKQLAEQLPPKLLDKDKATDDERKAAITQVLDAIDAMDPDYEVITAIHAGMGKVYGEDDPKFVTLLADILASRPAPVPKPKKGARGGGRGASPAIPIPRP